MKARLLLQYCTLFSLSVLCEGCGAPYLIESYTGSLAACLDIQGTYENQDINRQPWLALSGAIMTPTFGALIKNAISEKKFSISSPTYFPLPPSPPVGGKRYKQWMSFKLIDEQHLEVVLFNEEGQSVTGVIDMRKESDSLSCTPAFWENSSSQFRMGEGTSRSLRYSKTTKQRDGSLLVDSKSEGWQGHLGITYMRAREEKGQGIFRRVDLTLDDILEKNEKAKKAIEQYPTQQ